MRYRTMDISDYDKVVSLWRKSEGVQLREADSYEGIEKYLKRNPGLSFVCEDKTKIVGTIMSGHDGKRGYVQHLAVEVSMQGKGIGSELISRCLEALQLEGIIKSHIHVLASNELAKKFWLNRGWQERIDLQVFSFIISGGINA